MILTDREIQIALQRKQIIIEPLPQQDTAYSSTSVDLTLDPVFTIFSTGNTFIAKSIDPTHPDYNIDDALNEITKSETIDPTSGFQFKPRELVLGWTAEYVKLPYDSRLAARVEGKSSLARLGLGVHVTAPTIHAGFDGQIRLELVNHGPLPIVLKPGMRICQLIFEQTLGTPQRGYQGQFSGQSSTK
ncbi:MAG: dCTP deaminase [Rhodopseudomonas palustris]|uniref:dCTP deaminase n=1 Tax=Rhodopseudomonas palustris TaxID=1076 RepID=A0A933VTX3_RHOPL|nr:dCTP deaminase [Rhodopseudomonas palustris]